jgi:hypothetical protein
MVVMAALRPSETTFPLCHLDLPHKPLHTASKVALRLVSNRVRLEVAMAAMEAVVAAATNQDPDKINVEGMVRVATASRGTMEDTSTARAVRATVVEGEAMAVAAVMEVDMAATPVVAMVAVETNKAAEEGTRKSFQRVMEQLLHTATLPR